MTFKPTYIALVAWIVLTFIFWGNVFRFHPSMIDSVYDGTSEELVIGRMARSAADGLFSENADIGTNTDPAHPKQEGSEYYEIQKRYFENPSLVDSLKLGFEPYPSHFALQGIVFSLIDRITPLPRTYRIAFYHLLAAMFAAGMLVWIADILRERFGWYAFGGFLFPVAFEPMFPALAPSLYWVVGTWFVPMLIAMHLSEADEPKKRFRLIALVFLFFLIKCLCGYEFTSTVILAAAVGCMLSVREDGDRLRRMLRDVFSTIGAGVAGFAVAVLLHAARQGGFAVVARKAANRMTGDAGSFQDEVIFGKFASIGSVVSTYLESNFIALIKNFGMVLALLVAVAIIALLDGNLNWHLGPKRRKLQILALAFLASLAAPLSWIVLAKAHSFVHPHIDLIMWYVPTIPLGCAMVGVSLAQTIENRAAWKLDAARSFITAGIPLVVLGSIAAIYFADRSIQTQATWVIAAHENGVPLFKSDELGVDFRMTDQWFIVQYNCRLAKTAETFFIRAGKGEETVNYDFQLADKEVFSRKGRCYAAQSKTHRRFDKIRFGQMAKQRIIWEREMQLTFPDTFTPEPLNNVDWDRGLSRSSGRELLVRDDEFAKLFIQVGDRLQFAPSDERKITGISPAGQSKVISFDGPAMKFADGKVPPIKIIRE